MDTSATALCVTTGTEVEGIILQARILAMKFGFLSLAQPGTSIAWGDRVQQPVGSQGARLMFEGVAGSSLQIHC